MANPTTAEEWKQSAAALERQRLELFGQFDAVRNQQASLRQSILDYNRVISNPNSSVQEKYEAQQQKTVAQSQISQLDNQAAQLESQADSLRDQRNQALANANTAETGPPNTSPNTAPANPNPGNNTEPAPTTPAISPTELSPVDEGLQLPPGADADEGRQPGLAEPPDDDGVLRTPGGDEETGERAETGLQEPPIDDGVLRTPGGDEETGERAETGLQEPPVDDGVLRTPDGQEETGERAQTGLQEPPDNQQTSTAQSNGASARFSPTPDWRVRLSLAPDADYLYKVPAGKAGILNPLQATKGVIFPYTPTISVTYSANYDANDITHSNYKIYTYRGSAVENISITGDFTAQDSAEANYMLAVIHFFRTVTKMFYGQDQNPARGVPPPLCYLSGHGQYQFDNHPLAITNFTYTLPTDVDYVNAYPDALNASVGGINLGQYRKPYNSYSTPLQRLFGSGLRPGGVAPRPFTNAGNPDLITRVPTKISIALQCIPIVTRNAVSNEFSLARYATGDLLRGSKNPRTGGGMW